MKQNLKQTARKRLAAMALFLLICLPFSLAQAQTISISSDFTEDTAPVSELFFCTP